MYVVETSIAIKNLKSILFKSCFGKVPSIGICHLPVTETIKLLAKQEWLFYVDFFKNPFLCHIFGVVTYKQRLFSCCKLAVSFDFL